MKKKTLAILVTLVGALCFAAVSAADDGDHGKHKGQHKGDHTRMTFTLTTTDNGCSGLPWATDTVRRTWEVKANGDGTYTVTRFDRGTFLTTGGVSPGNCPENQTRHGHAVRAGVTGRVVGYIRGTVTGGTFNPNATCTTVGGCGTRSAFILTFFGPTATWSCDTNSTDCKFNFNYAAPHQSLLFRHWQDKGTGAGTMLHEVFHGDIADA